MSLAGDFYIGAAVSQLNAVEVEITVLLGRSLMPMQQLLRMGRGAVIHLDSQEHDEVWVLANNHPIARGELVVEGDKISVQITRAAPVEDFFATEQ
jgi:flagellar motor switch protein FliN/FliY